MAAVSAPGQITLPASVTIPANTQAIPVPIATFADPIAGFWGGGP